MINSYRVIIFIFILPLILMIAGCVSSGRTIQEQDKIQYYKPPALSTGLLNKRIDEIKNMLKEDSLPDDRKEAAISLLKAYDKLKSLNNENITEKEYRKTVQLLFNSLAGIEQQYFYSGIEPGDTAREIVIESYSAFKGQIYEDYYAGNFTGVISGCGELMSRFGRKGLTPDLGILLVEALLKNNMTSDALTLAGSILGAVENRPDLIHLLADAIELELKTGNVEDARRLYEKLVDNINERNSIYRKAEKLFSENQGNEPAVDDESVIEKISTMPPEIMAQMEQLTESVKKLISRKDFSGARLELIQRRLRAEEGPELEMIEQLLKSVDNAEAHFDKENNEDKLKIEDARKLIEEEKYEDALNILDIAVTDEGNYEAERLKNEAIEKLITRDKNDAAIIYRAAKAENNIQRKRDLLLKARSIFQNLIDKYHASPLIDRVKRNLSVVDEELILITPDRE